VLAFYSCTSIFAATLSRYTIENMSITFDPTIRTAYSAVHFDACF